MLNLRCTDGTYPVRVFWRNMVTPYSSRKGKQIARSAHGSAGTGGQKKQMPICNRPDTGPTRHESEPTSVWYFIVRYFEESFQDGMQMTATLLTDAPAGSYCQWKSMPWRTISRNVRRLQECIAKTVKEMKFRTATALQWLLTHSYHAESACHEQPGLPRRKCL